MESRASTFGPFVLDRERQRLMRAGHPVPVGHRGYVLLETLLDAGGAPVSKQTLIDRAWPETTIEEGNLAVQISTLRRHLGDDDDAMIVTVPRLGYRLVAKSTDRGTEHDGPPLVAVLPFQNLSGDPEHNYFADGIVEDIITALSRFRSFAVMARNSTFVFKGRAVDVRAVSSELGARYVLEGSVRRAGNRLRVSAQLIDGKTGGHLWAQNYDGGLEDIFAMQDRITGEVASLVAPSVKDAELERARRSPPRIDVYDLYLRALAVAQSTRPGTTLRLIEAAERCLALDEDFGPALGLAAQGHIALHDMQRPGFDESIRLRGIRYARAALAAAGNDADVRAIGGMGLISLGREYEAGIEAARQAVADNPNSVNVLAHAGISEIRAGTLVSAETNLRRAIQFNPKSAIGEWLLIGMAHVRLAERNFEEATTWANRAYAAAPHNVIGLWMLTAANAHLGRIEQACQTRDLLIAVEPAISLSLIAAGQHMRDPSRIEVIIDGLRRAGVPE
jgi:TolB-like protein